MEYRYTSTVSLTSAIDGVDSQSHAPAALTPPPGKDPVPIVEEVGWTSEPVLDRYMKSFFAVAVLFPCQAYLLSKTGSNVCDISLWQPDTAADASEGILIILNHSIYSMQNSAACLYVNSDET